MGRLRRGIEVHGETGRIEGFGSGRFLGDPLVVRAGDDELVVAFALRLMAFAPKTGAALWSATARISALTVRRFSGKGSWD